MVVDPVAARLVVIVGAAAAHGEGADMPDFRQAARPAEVDLLLLGQGWRPVVPGAGQAAAASSMTRVQSLPGAVSPGGSTRRLPRLAKVPTGLTAPSPAAPQAPRPRDP